MNFGAIIIGDELLSGKRQDQHFAHTVQTLNARGLALKWCRIIGDDMDSIVATLQQTFALPEPAFCFGGIGATPDDRTRQSAAKAAGVPLIRHTDAVAAIEARFGDKAYPHRVLMADLPEGSAIIPNAYNNIPGFSFRRHYFLPGFPVMAWPMMEWVLDTHYADAAPEQRPVEESLVIYDAHESQLLDVMEDVVARYPALRLYSLPTYVDRQPRIELGVKGQAEKVAAAMTEVRATLDQRGLRYQ